MELKLSRYIEQLLKRAHYEYDPSVKDWVGWIAGYPGVYAQGRTVENVRADLASILEDFIVLDLQEGKKIPGFPIFSRALKSNAHSQKYAAAHKS